MHRTHVLGASLLLGATSLLGACADDGPIADDTGFFNGTDPFGSLDSGTALDGQVRLEGAVVPTDASTNPLDTGVFNPFDSGTSGDGAVTTSDGAITTDDSGTPASTGFPAVSDFAAMGPYATSQVGAASCTIHYPTNLGDGGLKHPVILWGNGTTASPGIYAAVLSHWASHGFIVAAADTSNAGSGEQMLACLDYLTTQNSTAGSDFEGHVDLSRVGASGHSQGGGGTIMAGADSRVKTTAPLQPYIGFIPGGGLFDDASITSQTGPMFLMSGSSDTVARRDAQQQPVFDGVTVPTFWGTLQGADHIGSATGNISGYRGPATAWFRLQLMGDTSGRDLFYGASCGLCGNPEWEVERKGIQ